MAQQPIHLPVLEVARAAKAAPSAKRKRPNAKAAAGNLRMILRLSKNVDWDSEPDISSIIETARLARAALAELGEPE